MKIFRCILLMLSLYLLSSCESEYYYLTENSKEYLFYNKGDNLLFINEKDSLYGYVDSKEFWTTSSGIFGTVYHEIGQVHIRLLNDTNNVAVFLEVVNRGDKVEISYEFNIGSLNQMIDTCMRDRIAFYAFIFEESLYNYNLQSQNYVKMYPIVDETYELVYENEYCISQKGKLQINKLDGLTLLKFNESDTLIIERI